MKKKQKIINQIQKNNKYILKKQEKTERKFKKQKQIENI